MALKGILCTSNKCKNCCIPIIYLAVFNTFASIWYIYIDAVLTRYKWFMGIPITETIFTVLRYMTNIYKYNDLILRVQLIDLRLFVCCQLWIARCGVPGSGLVTVSACFVRNVVRALSGRSWCVEIVKHPVTMFLVLGVKDIVHF